MGLGHNRAAHRRAREALWAAWRPGTPCPRCNKPTLMGQRLQADHTETPSVLDVHVLPDALSHATCNEYAGGVLRALRAGHRTKPHPDPDLERVRQGVIAQARALGLVQDTEPTITRGRASRAW